MRQIFIVFSLLIICALTYAQPLQPYINMTDSAKQLYHQYAYNKYAFVNGREYLPYYNPTQTTPILEAMMSTGTIYYNGFKYSNLTLGYDSNLDELIAMPKEYISNIPIYVQINKSKVDSFLIKFQSKSYFFKNLSFKNNELPDGYYEIAYKGKYTLMIKHTCLVTEEESVTTYNPNMLSYIVDNNKIYPIRKKKELLNLFEDHKKQIKKRIRQYQVSYIKLSNTQLANIIRYIESF